MRYFLDTEYNGTGGELISLALVPEDGGEELYLVLPLPETVHEWVQKNVVPYLDMIPADFPGGRTSRESAPHEVARYLSHDHDTLIVADWPEDIALFCQLLVTGPGDIADVYRLKFELLRTPGFSTARNSKVPHNALHDARALRDFVLEGGH
ncbi:3'-5' exoribonuclease [Allosphingosinicella vermicomposti]|uniref:3'-5' exoribonuclease n=1 Tax=Allosphingosinicella vermicomposti TaxID=614671 RepID=UPI000D10A58F|nr:3'-5' exoribonuclease [Allosphingosinicella vermicomposti]